MPKTYSAFTRTIPPLAGYAFIITDNPSGKNPVTLFVMD